MASHVITRRIQYIIQFVYDNHFPSKEKIIEFLNDCDFNVSNRTIDRDLERIRADYGLEIEYNKAKNGYFINDEKSVKVSSFFKFMELVTVTDIFSVGLKDSNKILESVSFDDSKSFRGLSNLKPILIAISQNRKLNFIHESFQNKTFKNYVITPLILKEYENRWYVVGVPEDLNEFRTFGIDRLTEVTVGAFSKLNKKKYQSKLEIFKHVVGLDFEKQKPVKIRLLVNELHINYMRSLPVHHSQVIHSENEKGQHFVDFYLIPNFEFKSQILKMGDDAEVIYPESLKVEIKNTLERTLDKYQLNS